MTGHTGSLPIPGTLLISGAGRVEDLRPRFLEAAGGPKARILLIPSGRELKQGTDAYAWPTVPEFADHGIIEFDIGDPDFKEKWNWVAHWFQDAGLVNGALLHTDHREVADSDAFCAHIREADGIFFTGGTPSQMMPAYRGTLAHREFQALIDRGGAVVGFSAGASIQGALAADTEVDPFLPMFGFLPNTAIQTHFLVWNHQFRMPAVIEENPEVLGIGLDERSAIVVHGDEFEVIGTSYVAIYDYNKVLLPDGKFYLIAPGDRFSLSERRVVGESKTYLKQLVEMKWSELG